MVNSSAFGASALGSYARAEAFGSIAIGGDGTDLDSLGALASSDVAIAIGADAAATASYSIALEQRSLTNNVLAVAVGGNANALGVGATALGPSASATESATAVGSGRCALPARAWPNWLCHARCHISWRAGL